MKKKSLAALIIFVTQVLMTNSCFAFGSPTSFISGSVWIDSNQNQVQELDEELVADIKVFAQNQDTKEIVETRTRERGTFVMSGMPYGLYTVWCEDNKGAKTSPTFIELNEVVGTAEVINFALPSMKLAPTDDIDLETHAPGFSKSTNFIVYLPLINN